MHKGKAARTAARVLGIENVAARLILLARAALFCYSAVTEPATHAGLLRGERVAQAVEQLTFNQ